MAADGKYDLDEFRKLVLDGKAKPEIMKIMGIKGYPQFSSLELKLFKTDKKVYDIATTTTKGITSTKIVIGGKGNITIPKDLLENSQNSFKVGDAFTVNIKNKKIILTLVEKEESTEPLAK